MTRRMWAWVAWACAAGWPAARGDHAAAVTAVNGGNTAYFAGDYAAAASNFTVAVTNEDTWAVPYNNRGLARFRLGDLSGAEVDFNAAASMSNTYVAPRLNLGKCLAAQKRLAEAAAALQAGLAIDSNSVPLLYNLGWVRDEQGQYAEAESHYVAALALSSNYHRARAALAVTWAKQGQTSNAVDGFYSVIRGVTNDSIGALCAYDLQLLRGPGVDFDSDTAADEYREGMFQLAAQQYTNATARFDAARAAEADVPEIPWMASWACAMNRETNRANAYLAAAAPLMPGVRLDTFGPSASLLVDGWPRGASPRQVPLFASEYDLFARSQVSTQTYEWVGRLYTDGTPGGTNVVKVNPMAVPHYTAFGPIADADRDWLADDWEMHWFSSADGGPASDETDHDGLANLREHWYSSNPTAADSDGDGVPDLDEVTIFNSDPARSNAFYYVNDATTTNDAWCTAAGDDAQTGLDPAHPKATVQAILAAYDLEGGDVVVIDTGAYALTSNITVAAADSGRPGATVNFLASPYGVAFNRGSTSSGHCAWDIQGSNVWLATASSTRYPSLPQSWMRLTGGYYGAVFTGNGSRVSRITAWGNYAAGLRPGGSVTAENCLAGGSTRPGEGAGISIASGLPVIRNCTIAGNAVYGVRMNDSGGVLKNNIVVADGSGDYAIHRNWTGSSLTSDHNLLFATNGASVGYSGGACRTLREWRQATAQDANSRESDPLFVDPAGADYHVRSTAGSYHGGAWTADAASSPAIDAGIGDAGAEPEPNLTPGAGADLGRRNLGAYGGTEQGSKTPLERSLWLVAPVGGENFLDQGRAVTARWSWAGTSWQSNDTIRIEYSANGGATWNIVAGAAALGVLNGMFAWDISGLPAGPLYLLRVVDNQDGAGSQTAARFRIGANLVFYVNDGAATNDNWCTATGDDANTGLDEAHPKATVQAVLAEYDLEGGDVVRIDTGLYGLTNNIEVTAVDGGESNAPVAFEASPYGVTFNRGNTAGGSYAWSIAAGHVWLSTVGSSRYPALAQTWLKISGAAYGVYATGAGSRLCRVDACDNHLGGVWLSGSVVMENCLARGSGHPTEGAGVYISAGTPVVSNCTIAGNAAFGVRFYNAGGVLGNNIIAADAAGAYAIYRGSTGYAVSSDGNLLSVASGASAGYSGGVRATLRDWQRATGQDANSLSRNPLFVDPAAGDFHVQSTAGSYHGGAWTADAADSPAIDAGLGDAGAEPAPNFTPAWGPDWGRRNLGAYGGTDQGSKTPTGRCVRIYSPLEGDNYLDLSAPVTCRWAWAGGAWQGDDTVRLEYSTDGGGSWQAMGDGHAVAATNGWYGWDVAGAVTSPFYRVRITCNQDATATDQSPDNFRMGPGLIFYVNDDSTADDEWCSAAGDDANAGIDPSGPKATVQAVLNAYDLEPGDTVRIDTGWYDLTGNLTVGLADGGTNGTPVVFQASPYGVVFNRNNMDSGCYGWEVAADYVRLTTVTSAKYPALPQAWMEVVGAYYGVSVSGGYCQLSRVDAWFNYSAGFYLNGTGAGVENCLARNSTSGSSGAGIYVASGYPAISNCTVWANGKYGIYFRYVGGTLRNNVIGANGSGDYGIYRYSTGYILNSDYNLFAVTNGAILGGSGGDRPTLSAWQAATGLDANSLEGEPRFVNATRADYHLQSTMGSYHGGMWTADPADSPGLDMGAPGSPCAAEPFPNGGCVNLGAYGNTEQASKSRDTDGDGLSDAFESGRSGSSPLLRDTDGDRAGDGDEVTAGTSPTNAASVFAIDHAIRIDPAHFAIWWYSVSNRTYAIERATSLAPGDFTAVTNNLPATPPVNVYTDTVDEASGACFYRARTQR